jgi:probable HAF family extracellular repeat protein
MALLHRTSIGRHGTAAIAAAILMALGVASSGPARGQDAGEQAAPAAEMMAPGGMQMMGGDDGGTAPLAGHGFLLDGEVFTTIDHPNAVAETAVLGINRRGQIVGGYVDAEGTVRSFLLDDGVFTPIEHPDAGAATIAFGINDRGQIVGTYIDADGRGHGFLLDRGRGARRDTGVFTTIDHPDAGSEPGTGTAAFGVNDRGRIVGTYIDPGGAVHGFVRDKGRRARRDEGAFTTIDFPGAPDTLALAINNRDQIVGASIDAENTKRGFLLQEGEFTAIDHPDATSEVEGGGTALYGLNDRGQIVGQYSDSSCHGFLLDGDTFTTIDNPDAQFATGAADINDRGQIVGFYDGGTGTGQCAQQAPPSAPGSGSIEE